MNYCRFALKPSQLPSDKKSLYSRHARPEVSTTIAHSLSASGLVVTIVDFPQILEVENGAAVLVSSRLCWVA